MPDHPILFSGSMVRAILEGRKTQTRRILKPQPKFGFKPWQDECNGQWMQSGHGELGDSVLAVPCAPGDRLWVREAWADLTETHGRTWERLNPKTGLYERGKHKFVWHRADGEQPGFGGDNEPQMPWRPSIHMPRWASRITLLVTGVKVERLQDISEADAIAEGIEPNCDLSVWRCYLPEPKSQDYWLSPVESFRTLWSSINGPDSWTANPWVAAYTFKPIFQNIDIIRKEAA